MFLPQRSATPGGLNPAGSLGGRRERDDRLSLVAARRSAYEVDLAADAREEVAHERIGRHLAGEIDGEGGVDRDHALVPRDVERVVREVAGPHLHDGVATGLSSTHS
jgi:hypothetical protein